ncbi:MAG: hypothetical protein M3003_04975 [Candidatus Dormibacteraeota bacterium]|nr:hypothetical protein [Candidatus Dormibacteraeota bacterium]
MAALYVAVSLAIFVVLLVVVHESPAQALLIALPVGVAALALAFALSWFSPPLGRDHAPMRLPPFKALARRRHRWNPFFVEHVTMRSPYRAEWCRTELARVLLSAPYIPGPRGAMTGLVGADRFTLRRVTLWHDDGRPLASGTLKDAEPGTLIRMRVAPPAVSVYLTFAIALWIGALVVIGFIGALLTQPVVTLLALAAVVVLVLGLIAVGAGLLRLAARLGVHFIDVPESDRIVEFLQGAFGADVVSRE